MRITVFNMTFVCHSQTLDEGTHPCAWQQVWLSHSSLGKVALPTLPKQDSWQSDLKGKSFAWQQSGARVGSPPSLQKRRVSQPHRSGTVGSAWQTSGDSAQAAVSASRHPGGVCWLLNVPGRSSFPPGKATGGK